MTHLYTLLVGGTIIRGRREPDATAIAWAEGVVIAIGSDDAVRSISRGDSDLVNLHGAVVMPLAPGAGARWPVDAMLEVGGPADLAVLRRDPRTAGPSADPAREVLALIRAGRLVLGTLPSESEHAIEPEAEADPHRPLHRRLPG